MNRKSYIAAGVLSFTALAAQAAPEVDGNTIQLPDDGWYQVQSASDYSSICQGVSACEVEAGSYIVINHTSGERFNVTVTGDSEASAVSVEGDTLHWPDDGWYQVQRQDTYETVCEGGRSCQVEPGTYQVINHTTGERFSNIVVESGAGETHSVLGVGEHREISTSTFDRQFSDNSSHYLVSLFSFKSPLPMHFSESAASHISRVLYKGTILDQTGSSTSDFVSTYVENTTVTSETTYQCDAGGTMTYSSNVDTSINTRVTTNSVEDGIIAEFEFNECHSVYDNADQYVLGNGAYNPLGEYTLNGSYKIEVESPASRSGYIERKVNHSWDQFVISGVAPSRWSMSANGESEYSYFFRRSVQSSITGNVEYSLTGENGDILQQLSVNMPAE